VGSQNPNDTTGIAAAEFLKVKISDVRSTLSNMSFSKTIPVGYADAGSYFNTDILEAVDYASECRNMLCFDMVTDIRIPIYVLEYEVANVHPWYVMPRWM
jgi:hypothetical protein